VEDAREAAVMTWAASFKILCSLSAHVLDNNDDDDDEFEQIITKSISWVDSPTCGVMTLFTIMFIRCEDNRTGGLTMTVCYCYMSQNLTDLY